MKITNAQSSSFSWDLISGNNYKFPDFDQSVSHVELREPHGVVSTTDKPRIYYILEGNGIFVVGGKDESAAGDVILIPPHTTFDYRPANATLKVLLFMEYWDSRKLE